MVKAEVKKKDGTHILIDGSEEEVKRILALISNTKSDRKTENREGTKSSKISLTDMIHELREEGFFNKPKSLVEIKNGLATRGRIYEVTSLSAAVLRQVRKRNLGRIKDENKWKYVLR